VLGSRYLPTHIFVGLKILVGFEIPRLALVGLKISRFVLVGFELPRFVFVGFQIPRCVLVEFKIPRVVPEISQMDALRSRMRLTGS